MAETITPEELSTLEKFKQKAAEFVAAFNRLIAMDNSVAPTLRPEYNSLRSKAQIVMNTVKAVTSAVDSVTGFFSSAYDTVSNALKSAFGLGLLPAFNARQLVTQSINNPLQYSRSQQLGVVPLIPIAAVIAASAAMVKIISDVYTFERKNSEQIRLEKTGLTPQAAAKIVSQTMSTGDFFGLQKLVMPLGLGIIGFIAYKLMVKK